MALDETGKVLRWEVWKSLIYSATVDNLETGARQRAVEQNETSGRGRTRECNLSIELLGRPLGCLVFSLMAVVGDHINQFFFTGL